MPDSNPGPLPQKYGVLQLWNSSTSTYMMKNIGTFSFRNTDKQKVCLFILRVLTRKYFSVYLRFIIMQARLKFMPVLFYATLSIKVLSGKFFVLLPNGK